MSVKAVGQSGRSNGRSEALDRPISVTVMTGHDRLLTVTIAIPNYNLYFFLQLQINILSNYRNKKTRFKKVFFAK